MFICDYTKAIPSCHPDSTTFLFKHLRLIYLEDQTQEVFASNDILFDSSSLYYAVMHFGILCKWKNLHNKFTLAFA